MARPDVDLVIEVIGGIEPARTLILSALPSTRLGGHCEQGTAGRGRRDPLQRGGARRADLYFEAAVAGAIPIIRPLRESLVGDEITSVIGIVNGTTNFILDKMDSAGAGYAETLAEAQDLGYAEADPTADVEGFDAAAKAAILASLAFHTRVTAADVYREGITEVTASDMASAGDIGCVVKLLAICQLPPGGGWHAAGRVRWPRAHGVGAGAPGDDPAQPSARGGRRRVQRRVRGVEIGRPADVLRTGRRRLTDGQRGTRRSGHGRPQPGPWARSARGSPATPLARWCRSANVSTRYHLSLAVADVAGVLARIATVFADHGVSIQTVRQHERGADAQVVIVTHAALDSALSATVESLRT